MISSSDDSSFRQMYHYPNDGHVNKHRKYLVKGQRIKRNVPESGKVQKETFYDVVQKAKNVALFTRNLKQRVAQNRTFNTHNLKSNELQYLESDSQNQYVEAYFSHDNWLILGIEIAFIGTMLLYLWQCTFQIVFGELQTNEIINGIALVFYMIHIVLFQYTEYKNQKSELIQDVNIIRSIYWNQRMVKDGISLFVIMLQLTPLDNYETYTAIFMILRILSLLSYLEMSASCQKVQNLLVRSTESQSIISVIKLLYKLFLFLHLLTMSLNLMVTIQRSLGVPVVWLDNSNISFGTNIQKYVLGWYWGATILSTVGFGQIIPANNAQRFVLSFIEIFCSLSFAYFVNAIGQIIKMRAQSSQKYQKEVRRLNRYLNDIYLTNDLKHKIRTHYFNKHLIEQKHDPNEEKQVLNTITPNLKTSLLQEINMKIVKKCNVLEGFRGETIKSISESIKRTILAPEYILYSRNSSDRKLWFIENGQVQEQTDIFQHSNLKKVLTVYNQKNPLIGWINFLMPGIYKTMAKAKNFTIAHQLQQSQFIKCLEPDVGEYHKFLQIKHRMIQKNKYFDNKCISCGRYTHNVLNCPRIHLVKKDAYKIAQQKINISKYRSGMLKKISRNGIKYNWKLIFGDKELQRQVNLLTNNQNTVGTGTGSIQRVLEDLAAFKGSATNFGRKRVSVINGMVPRDFRRETEDNIRQSVNNNKILQNGNRSMLSFDSDEQQSPIEFQKAFYNKEYKSYMPLGDIEEVLAFYHKKANKKKIESSKKINHYFKK